MALSLGVVPDNRVKMDDQTARGQPLDPRRKAKYNVISRGFFWLVSNFLFACFSNAF